MRDLGRFVTGPAYARRLVTTAERAGVDVRTSTMVTGWADEHTLEITSPSGREQLTANAIVVATGARERPRAARWIPGDRPAGVFTTGELQQVVHLEHLPVGTRAVIVGSELVSWSAVLTLRTAGVKPVALVTESQRPQSYAAFTYPGQVAFGTPVIKGVRVSRVIGHGRVTGVEIERIATRERTVIACDTVVFTGDWIPDHELVRAAGIGLDADTLGPRVDAGLRTDRDGVFAAGNVIHPVDTADIAALDGEHVATAVLDYLRHAPLPEVAAEIVADAPFRWAAPSVVRAGDREAARGRLLLWPDAYVPIPTVVARQGGRVIGRARVLWPAAPGRVFRAPWSLVAGAVPGAGEVRIGLG